MTVDMGTGGKSEQTLLTSDPQTTETGHAAYESAHRGVIKMIFCIRVGQQALVNRFLSWSCCFVVCCIPLRAQTAAVATIHAAPGTAVRWVAFRDDCLRSERSILGRRERYLLLSDRSGGGTSGARIAVSRTTAGKAHFGHIVVDAIDYGTEDINLPDIPQANPGAEDLRRDERDRVKLAKIFNRKEGLPKFTLPLGAPAHPLPPAKSFGVKRIFNGKPASQPHTGVDYATPVGSPVLAVANGTVRMAEEMFFEGNAAFIDHGDGLISMYFHLSDIKVQGRR